jgi:prolipoprotein diacylglyceryltransferase
MLFVALLVCNWVAGKRAEEEGVAKERVQDLAIWLVLFGLIGARTTYLLQEKGITLQRFFSEFLRIWDGGIILYGAVIGGVIGLLLAYVFVLRRYQLSTWKMADIIAPAFALGLCIGRFGCLLNGCCFGNVVCSHVPAIDFPLSAPPRYVLTEAGLQTSAGFTTTQKEGEDPCTVDAVEPGSEAEHHGLQPGDVIVAVNGKPIMIFNDKPVKDQLLVTLNDGDVRPFRSYPECVQGIAVLRAEGKEIVSVADGLDEHLVRDWPRGLNELSLRVRRGMREVDLPPFSPRSLGLHPTQVYESVSMGLAFLLLTAFYPFHRRDGQVIALLMLCYGLHRFLNEQLRNDPRPVGFENYISIGLIVAALALSLWLWRQPATATPASRKTEALQSL